MTSETSIIIVCCVSDVVRVSDGDVQILFTVDDFAPIRRWYFVILAMQALISSFIEKDLLVWRLTYQIISYDESEISNCRRISIYFAREFTIVILKSSSVPRFQIAKYVLWPWMSHFKTAFFPRSTVISKTNWRIKLMVDSSIPEKWIEKFECYNTDKQLSLNRTSKNNQQKAH